MGAEENVDVQAPPEGGQPQGGEQTTPEVVKPPEQKPEPKQPAVDAGTQAALRMLKKIGWENMTPEQREYAADFVPDLVDNHNRKLVKDYEDQQKEKLSKLRSDRARARYDKLVANTRTPEDLYMELAEARTEAEELRETIEGFRNGARGLTFEEAEQLARTVSVEETAKFNFIRAPENQDVFGDSDATEYFFKLVEKPPGGFGRQRLNAREAIAKVREKFKPAALKAMPAIYATYEGTPTSPQMRPMEDPALDDTKRRYKETFQDKPPEERKAKDIFRIYS